MKTCDYCELSFTPEELKVNSDLRFCCIICGGYVHNECGDSKVRICKSCDENLENIGNI